MSASPFSYGVRILGSLAALMVLGLAVGFALPGTWSAGRASVVQAPPDVVYALLSAPASWQGWTAWPSGGMEAEGPSVGAGARLRWNDPEMGGGTFEIVEAVPSRLVRYRVEVQGGSLEVDGVLVLAQEGSGTRVAWQENGDFGWNPLMGYWARFMERVQGRQLEASLQRLDSVARLADPAGGG